MKKVLFIFGLLFLFTDGIAQTVRRVNNDASASAQYTSLQTAINQAVAGDIILIEGSATSYGDITLNKSVTLRGPGWYDPNNPVRQANQLTASINTLTLSSASPGSNGAIIESLSINNIRNNNGSGTFYNLEDITIRRCIVGTVSFGNTTTTVQGTTKNFLISQTLFNNFSYIGHAENLTIQNSIIRFYNYIYHNNSILFNQCVWANDIYGDNQISWQGGTNSSVAVMNSIVVSTWSSINILSGANNSFSFLNTLFRASSFTITQGTSSVVSGNGNQFEIDMGFVFSNASTTVDGKWMLATDSPAKGAGVEGADVGAFGGNTPFILSGIPAAPVIMDMSTSGGGTNSIPLKVKITAKGNQ